MKTHQKSDPKMEPKSIKNHSKIDAKQKTKKEGLKLYKPSSAECASSPNPIISKDILRKKTNEESRLKGEYRVECKKWSAKGKCKRQVQTGNPLRTQTRSVASDHVRIQSLTRTPPGQSL